MVAEIQYVTYVNLVQMDVTYCSYCIIKTNNIILLTDKNKRTLLAGGIQVVYCHGNSTLSHPWIPP